MPAEPSTTSDVDANPLWGDDWPEVRALWPLEPTVAHLNHGSYGAVPTPVLEEQQSWRDRMESNPLRFLRREAAGRAGRGPGRGRRVPRCADRPRWRSCTTPPAARARCWPRSRSSRATPSCSPTTRTAPSGSPPTGSPPTGARASTSVHLPLAADDDEVVDAVLGAVHERTRLVVLDQVTSPTARRLPLVRLVPALQERGRGGARRRRPRPRDARGRPGPAGRRLLRRQPAQVVLRAPRHRRPARRGALAAGAAPAGRLLGGGRGLPAGLRRHRHRGPERLAVGAAGPAGARGSRAGPAAPAQRRARRGRPARGRRGTARPGRPTCPGTRP